MLKPVQEIQLKVGLTGNAKQVFISVYMDEEGTVVLGGYGWQEFYDYDRVQTQRWRDLEAKRIIQAIEPLPLMLGP